MDRDSSRLNLTKITITNRVSSTYQRPNSSIDHSHDQHVSHKHSKDKINKQPSTTYLRQLQLHDNRHDNRLDTRLDTRLSPLIRTNKDPIDINKENGQRNDDMRILSKYNKREFGSKKSGDARNLEVKEGDRQSFRKDNQSILKNYYSDNTGKNPKHRCHYCQAQSNSSVQNADRVDAFCCNDCIKRLTSKGLRVQDAEKVHHFNQLLKKSLSSIRSVEICIDNLNEHYRSIVSELDYQIHLHDNHYDSLITLLAKKKRETQDILQKSMGNIPKEFVEIRRRLTHRKTQLELDHQRMLVERLSIEALKEGDFKARISQRLKKLEIDEALTSYSIDSWKVEVADIKSLEKHIQKTLISVVDNPEEQKVPLVSPQESFGELVCSQQFDWHRKVSLSKGLGSGMGGWRQPSGGWRQPSGGRKEPTGARKEPVVNSIIYENSEQEVSSPGFKEI